MNTEVGSYQSMREQAFSLLLICAARDGSLRAEFTIIPSFAHFVNRQIEQIFYRADPEICANYLLHSVGGYGIIIVSRGRAIDTQTVLSL